MENNTKENERKPHPEQSKTGPLVMPMLAEYNQGEEVCAISVPGRMVLKIVKRATAQFIL